VWIKCLYDISRDIAYIYDTIYANKGNLYNIHIKYTYLMLHSENSSSKCLNRGPQCLIYENVHNRCKFNMKMRTIVSLRVASLRLIREKVEYGEMYLTESMWYSPDTKESLTASQSPSRAAITSSLVIVLVVVSWCHIEMASIFTWYVFIKWVNLGEEEKNCKNTYFV
jgi:hypothetical protein